MMCVMECVTCGSRCREYEMFCGFSAINFHPIIALTLKIWGSGERRVGEH